jgi:hypothetical protein
MASLAFKSTGGTRNAKSGISLRHSDQRHRDDRRLARAEKAADHRHSLRTAPEEHAGQTQIIMNTNTQLPPNLVEEPSSSVFGCLLHEPLLHFVIAGFGLLALYGRSEKEDLR